MGIIFCFLILAITVTGYSTLHSDAMVKAQSSSMTPYVEWNQTYSQVQRGPSWLVATNGGYSISLADNSVLIKVNADGSMQTTHNTAGGAANGDNFPSGLPDFIATSDGGYAFVTNVETWYNDGGTTPSYYYGLLVKTDGSGNLQWNQSYGGGPELPQPNASGTINSLVQTSDGGYALAGGLSSYDSSTGTTVNGFWLIKTDASGNIQWNKTVDSSNSNTAASIAQANDGGFYLTGGGTLVKTDSQGNMQWSKSEPSPALFVLATTDGGCVVTGNKFALSKYDSSGNLQWSQTFGQSGQESYGIVQTSDGGYALVGPGLYLVKTDSAGNKQWDYTNNGGSNNGIYAYSLAQTSDNGYVIAGTLWDGYSNYATPCLVKVGLRSVTTASSTVSSNPTANPTSTQTKPTPSPSVINLQSTTQEPATSPSIPEYATIPLLCLVTMLILSVIVASANRAKRIPRTYSQSKTE